MFATNRFVTSGCSGQSLTSRLRSITSWHMFVTVNVSFNAYACHEVHFVAKFMQSRTYVLKSSRHEVTFHHLIPMICTVSLFARFKNTFQTFNNFIWTSIHNNPPCHNKGLYHIKYYVGIILSMIRTRITVQDTCLSYSLKYKTNLNRFRIDFEFQIQVSFQ